jgi:trk system potassium uptake protein TrkH
MNFRLLAKVLGLLLTLESVAMGACGLFARFDSSGGSGAAVFPLFTGAAVTFMAGILLVIVGIGKYDRIPRREGVVIVGLGWLLCGFFGAIPYELAEPGLKPHAAIFESISGFTTTGSTVIDDLDEWPRGILMWRAVTQWLGGLGILVLFVAVLSTISGGAKSLFRNESSFQSGEAATARIRDTALMLWRTYLALTATCLLGLRALGMSWFDAVAHALTCVSTGGFSPYNDSIGHFSDWETGLWIELWLVLFMTLCSMSFLIYVVILRRNWKRLRNEEEGRWFLLICALASVGVAFAIWAGNPGVPYLQALRESVFTVVSIASTTGFGTVDYEGWPTVALMLLAGLMLLGGCSGSTAGGMKVSRLLLLLKAAFHEIVRAFRPNQVFRMQVNGNPLDDNARGQTILFVALFGFLVLISPALVSLLEFERGSDAATAAGSGIDPVTAVGSVFATLGNIGPGFGEVGPTDNFSGFRPATQLFLALLMVLGRLELYAVLVLFVPAAWKKY